MDSNPVTELSNDECWEFLASKSFGRLAFTVGETVDIVPLNFVADADRLIFRTAQGTKLFGLTMNSHVALEIDQFHDDYARSVVVRGRARQLEGREAEKAEELPLRPWFPSLKYIFVEINPEEISGRLFHLGPEPERY